MAILSDNIERFIKQLMEDAEGMLELQRNELADYFKCAPSQINYVLSTRFTPEKGYLTESRRGGGGYIRVTRLNLNREERLLGLIRDRLNGGSISEREARAVINDLYDLEMATKKEARMMLAAISDKALGVPGVVKDDVRAGVLKQMLIELLAD